MLKVFPEGPLQAAAWIDMIDPTPDEVSAVEAATGFTIPSRAALSEIESTSRLKVHRKVLYLSTAFVMHGDTPEAEMTPIGFILSDRRLVTVRFGELKAFGTAFDELGRIAEPHGVCAFTLLFEAMVDRAADLLEACGAEFDATSHQIFRQAAEAGPRVRGSGSLRQVLVQVGRLGDRLGKIRGSILGLGRVVPFVLEVGRDWIDPEFQVRLAAVKADVVSLADFQTHLEGRNQFLLDAVLGFISTDQNDLFKILTIVSVVGVLPTLVASIYGMNFAAMPELHWRLGYPYALALIVITTVAPILWFKWKRWW